MVFDRIKEILVELLDLEPERVTRDTDLLTDLGADSLDLVELIMTLEEEYGITAPDDSIYENRTVGDIADYIEELIK